MSLSKTIYLLPSTVFNPGRPAYDMNEKLLTGTSNKHTKTQIRLLLLESYLCVYYLLSTYSQKWFNWSGPHVNDGHCCVNEMFSLAR